jgi:ribosomal protein L16 Arg81 hydroxylase
MTTVSSEPPQTDDLINVRLDLVLTREQLRDFLGWSVVRHDATVVENNLANIRAMIREAVQVHIVSAERNWDLLATEDQISTVDRAVARLAPKS